MRVLLVDDDAALRVLLRTTFEVFDIDVDEAADARGAERAITAAAPDVVVLDVRMPGMDGLAFCRQLKADRATRGISVVVLSGSDGGTADAAREAGAEAALRKPFSPLQLLAVVEQLAGSKYGIPFRPSRADEPEEQLLLYAHDLRHLLEIEKGQRALVQSAYRETVAALASALESKDTGTRQHSQRVQQYAIELARAVEPALLEDASTEYGFVLHDIGKIGIPDLILQKPKPLTESEARLMRTHTVLGEQVLSGVAFFHGEGIRIVRSHHERWDGDGYPDGLGGDEIPVSARVFAVADALDAMTSDRPYRRARRWVDAGRELVRQSGTQFDPQVVRAFVEHEAALRAVRDRLEAAYV
ncbi:MAG TPA: HD domain-containing phosphohydrolase [Gaiellaceae bacterium]|nr:HD domain-containing phosphohydrolase [Gaiellaceae bacterium]